MIADVRSAADKLFAMVEEQQGYFTAKQAAEAGYKLGSLAHHVKCGNWLRVERGVYRLAHFPQSAEEQLVIYSLWSRNRTELPEGTYSHQTALSIHELSDANPAKLHMTVPLSFRRTAAAPKLLILHRAFLADSDVEHRHGFSVTNPLRTIVDLACGESVPQDIVEQALTQARQRGLITTKGMAEIRCAGRIPDWFHKMLIKHK